MKTKKAKTSYSPVEKTAILEFFGAHGLEETCAKYPGVTRQAINVWTRFSSKTNPKPGVKPGAVGFANYDKEMLIVENQKLRNIILELLG